MSPGADPPSTASAFKPSQWARLRAVVQPHWMATLVVVAVLAAGAYAGRGLLLGPEVAVDCVTQRDFVQSVVASGHVEAPHRVSVGSQIVGTVRRVPVKEGQAVEAGQVLIELESTEAQAAAVQADAAVVQAEARLRQMREVQAPVAEQAVRQAQANLDNARAQARRNAALVKQGFIGQAAMDDIQKAVTLAEAQWRSAIKQSETALPSGSDHALAVAALAQARASADAARSRLRYATIVAPVAGTLISRTVEAGDVVQSGKALMVLSPSGDSELVAQIDEKNLQMLALGQPAQASADAYAQQRFPAKLAYINPGVDVQRGSVEVKLSVPNPPDYLRQDMTVSIDIQVARRKQAVLVATDALRDLQGDRAWVLKVQDSRARRQDVRIGLRSGGMAEVLEGLAAGDRVVPATVLGLRPDARLRPIAAQCPAPAAG